MGAILCIDQGTSGTKAVVVDGDDKVLATQEIPLRPQYGSGGRVEQDPQELLDSVMAASAQALAAARTEIEAVALSNQGETVLAWDPTTGAPLTTMLVWQDGRAQTVCDEVRGSAGMVAQRTGLVLDPYFSAPKMAWLRKHATTAGVVTTSDTWLLHHLTGEFVTDVSTASRSLITSLDTVEFDPELVGLFGLGGEKLPRIVANDEVLGETAAFGRPVPVTAVVDQQAALLAESCLGAGEAKCTFGTGAFLLANLGETPVRSTAGLTVSVAWRVEGRTSYCSDGQIYTAASAVRWLQDTGLLASPAELDAICTDDAHGVICVAAMAGLAAPYWRSDVQAAFHGISLATSRADLVTAVLQGLAAQVSDLGDLVAQDLGQPLTRLRVDGGLTRSRRFMQTVADLLQVQIDVYPSAHATPLGAGALARKALHPQMSLAEVVVGWEPAERYAPVWPAERAREFRERWKSVAAATVACGGVA